MTAPGIPANGDIVALRGLTSTTLLRRGEVKNFVWSAFYARYVSQGYAEVFSGASGGGVPAAWYVKSVNGSRPDAAGNVAVAGGGASNPVVAAFVTAIGPTKEALDGHYVPFQQLAKNPDLLISGAITRDANQAVTSAAAVWPDGTPGTFTALVLSATFPGAVDSYKITYGSPATKTYTQPTLTRNSEGAATALPAIVVS